MLRLEQRLAWASALVSLAIDQLPIIYAPPIPGRVRIDTMGLLHLCTSLYTAALPDATVDARKAASSLNSMATLHVMSPLGGPCS
jgi:hypothetical protein